MSFLRAKDRGMVTGTASGKGSTSTRFMADSDTNTWRSIRHDLEGLPPADWTLIWISHELVSATRVQSEWQWFRPTDTSLCARASAIFLKAAKARGYDNDAKWLDELRYSDFVQFEITEYGILNLPDGTYVDRASGTLNDAVYHSITLCHRLEAGGAPKPLVMRLPNEAMARIEEATTASLANVIPKLEVEANERARIHQTEVLRDFVIHQFNTVARECMKLGVSVDEFETELRGSIARFVQSAINQCRSFGSVRQEVNAGFASFVTGANPWSGIRRLDKSSTAHIGAIIREALFHSVSNLSAEASAHPAAGGFSKHDRSGGNEPSGNRSTRTEAPLAARTNDTSIKRLRQTVFSPVAARKLETYMESNGGQTAFAREAGTTERTLRSFRKTGRVRRDIFDAIARVMGTTPDSLVKPE